jgi:hypothetical protein
LLPAPHRMSALPPKSAVQPSLFQKTRRRADRHLSCGGWAAPSCARGRGLLLAGRRRPFEPATARCRGAWRASWEQRPSQTLCPPAHLPSTARPPTIDNEPSAVVENARFAPCAHRSAVIRQAAATQNRQSAMRVSAIYGRRQAGGQPTAARKGQAPHAPGTLPQEEVGCTGRHS